MSPKVKRLEKVGKTRTGPLGRNVRNTIRYMRSYKSKRGAPIQSDNVEESQR